MKNNVLTWFLFVFLLSGTLTAQEITPGFKTGLNFANLNSDASTDMTIGYYIGFLADIRLSEKFHLQPEVLYSREGAKDVIINYIKVPVMAKYYLSDEFALHAGPYISVITGPTRDFQRYDAGAAGGLSYEFPFGLYTDARYNFGVLDILNVQGASAVRNSVIQVGIGYKFQ
ncbi:MAG: porin family protein [Flavobacterium sp.]